MSDFKGASHPLKQRKDTLELEKGNTNSVLQLDKANAKSTVAEGLVLAWKVGGGMTLESHRVQELMGVLVPILCTESRHLCTVLDFPFPLKQGPVQECAVSDLPVHRCAQSSPMGTVGASRRQDSVRLLRTNWNVHWK